MNKSYADTFENITVSIRFEIRTMMLVCGHFLCKYCKYEIW